MDRLPELIAAFLAMDHFARNIIVDSARASFLTPARPVAVHSKFPR